MWETEKTTYRQNNITFLQKEKLKKTGRIQVYYSCYHWHMVHTNSFKALISLYD